jgi:hypothetical protein
MCKESAEKGGCVCYHFQGIIYVPHVIVSQSSFWVLLWCGKFLFPAFLMSSIHLAKPIDHSGSPHSLCWSRGI